MSLLDTNLDPVLSARQLTRRYGSRIGCKDVSLDLWPGEVLGIVGESGSGKSTLLNMLSGRLEPSAGHVQYTAADGKVLDIHSLDEAQRRRLLRTELGFVHQHARCVGIDRNDLFIQIVFIKHRNCFAFHPYSTRNVSDRIAVIDSACHDDDALVLFLIIMSNFKDFYRFATVHCAVTKKKLCHLISPHLKKFVPFKYILFEQKFHH